MNRRGHAGRVDANHTQIVAALRKAGVRVLSLASVGAGCPDLLCSFRHCNVLLEIKVPGEKLNKVQEEFHATWPGALKVVTTPEEAIAAVIEAARP